MLLLGLSLELKQSQAVFLSSVLGPTMAPPVWAMSMNFAFPKMKLFHMAFTTDFAKEKYSPVNTTKIQTTQYYMFRVFNH